MANPGISRISQRTHASIASLCLPLCVCVPAPVCWPYFCQSCQSSASPRFELHLMVVGGRGFVARLLSVWAVSPLSAPKHGSWAEWLA